MDALVSSSLCFASKSSTTVSVYGSTALRQWVAPHLRRMPGDLDLFAAVPDRQSFHRLCQTLADQLSVHPGASQEIRFVAYNPTDKPMTAQAIPSVSPSRAAAYFHKTECFCFTQQVLQPGERIEMPVRFIVDRDLPADVHHLILAYTLFDITSRQPPVAVNATSAPAKESLQ